jgi:cell division septal protein FtsQ
MSSTYALRDPVGPGAEASPGRRFARWARPALIALSAACAAALVGRFIAEPVMRIHHVVVQTDLALTDDEVRVLSGLAGSEHWYSVATDTLARRLEQSPLVRRATVQKVFPDTLRMTVVGRVPAALVLAASAGHTVPVLVDGEGVVYKIGASSAEIDMPVISGIAAGDTALGSALPRAYGPLFADLQALRESAPTLYALVSEVRVTSGNAAQSLDPSAAGALDPSAAGPLDLLVWLTCSPVPVRARGTVDEHFLRSTLMVLDLLSRQGVLRNIQELDLRSGDAVYSPRSGAAPAAGGDTHGS